MPKLEGTGSDRIVRYYYDTGAKGCKLFIYSGQGGNMNNFGNELECTKKCVHKGWYISQPRN